MEDISSTGRSRRQVIKRVAFSPEPAGTSHIKKSAPESKVSSTGSKRKSNTSVKNAGSRKSLPATLNVSKPADDVFNKSATESSSKTITEKSIPESKGKRLKLKPVAEIPSASNGVKVDKNVAEKKEEPKEQIGKAVKQTVADPPRRGLLALKRYVPPPEEKEIPQSLPSSSQNYYDDDPDVKEKNLNASADNETPANNTLSSEISKVEEPPFRDIENDETTLMMNEKDDALPAKLESAPQAQEKRISETENNTKLIDNVQPIALNDAVKTAEIININDVAEKPKKAEKVSPLKISLAKHRPSLPALPVKPSPLITERPSFSGRTRKPARSKEYPGHEEAIPSSSNANRKRSKFVKPNIPAISIPSTPMTPIPATVEDMMNLFQRTGDLKMHQGPTVAYMKPPIQSPISSPPLPIIKKDLPSQSAAYLSERPRRSKSKSILDFAPSLISKDFKRKSVTVPEEEHAQPHSVSQNSTAYPSTEPLDIEDEPIFVQEEEKINVPENFEIEDGAIFESQIEYLKSLHPHLQKSFEALESRYEDEYFLREILTHDIIDTEDNTISEEEKLDIDGIEEPVKSINYDLTFSTMKYAQYFVKMFSNNIRVSLDDIPNHIQTFLKENDATGICLKIFYEILQKQCCMEHAVQKHKNPVASYYLYSLQNATLLRSRIFLHFSYELVQAHEWLIRHLDEKCLASYLMILKFLQAAGTTLTNILITSANPTDLTNVTVNEHIRNMLEEKIRDPFSRMLTHLDRQLTNHETFLMLISPGIKLQNEIMNAVYHAHEQLFVGLTNMGCTIEKIIIKDDDNLSENFTVTEACEFAVNFIKNKILDAVKRRPNERIFIASWGVTCLFVHEAVIDVDGVSGIIDLAMPVKSQIGSRGRVGDRILLTYCPTMVVSGEDSGDLPDTAVMLNNFHISTGLCVIGKADSSLIVEPSLLANYGITQACISRIILNHVMDFIERVVKDTHNDIHTKKLEVDYPWIITEDLNDHVMRDDTAYGVDEAFFDDEEDSSSKPKEPIVVNDKSTIENLPLKEDDNMEDDDPSLQIIKPEPHAAKIQYAENGGHEFVENLNSEILQHPQYYEYGPSTYQPSYQQPMNVAQQDSGDILHEFLDNDVHYEEVVAEVPMEEYDEEMEFEDQMAAEAIEGGDTGEQNGYE